MARNARFSEHGPRSAAANPRSRDTDDELDWALESKRAYAETMGRLLAATAHESTHDKP